MCGGNTASKISGGPSLVRISVLSGSVRSRNAASVVGLRGYDLH
jgi:hypothetical protein